MFVGSTCQSEEVFHFSLGLWTHLDELKVVGGLGRVLGGSGSISTSVWYLLGLGSLGSGGRHRSSGGWSGGSSSGSSSRLSL
jgi:hypothetical protein